MKEELLKGLTAEQIAKVRKCKNTAEVLALIEEEDGIELTKEQLAYVSGGGRACDYISSAIDYIDPFDCPKCGRRKIKKDGNEYTCKKCHYTWIVNS